jgi:hypothetical protein
MSVSYRRAAVALGAAALLLAAPTAFAQSTQGSTAQTPGPQNPGARMPESGQIPKATSAPPHHGMSSQKGTSPGAQLSTGTH